MNTSVFSNMRARRARRSSGGFALLEALVALLLFSIGILGLLGLQARAISTASDAEDRNRAALIADQCASQMQLQASQVAMTTGAANLAAICHDWAVSDPARGGLPGGKIEVTPPTAFAVVPGGAPLAPVTVDIKVTWATPARNGTSGSASSQLTTATTLLVQNQ
jgi:type IV pilus assembly protein PilV